MAQRVRYTEPGISILRPLPVCLFQTRLAPRLGRRDKPNMRAIPSMQHQKEACRRQFEYKQQRRAHRVAAVPSLTQQMGAAKKLARVEVQDGKLRGVAGGALSAAKRGIMPEIAPINRCGKTELKNLS
mmetsp:Transcript_9123/g.16482  ORF Transcript_9123/g.16482 Transcript_9123/m.16482 type:complete len:128 (-) Transcript_9123:640-1023(-)